MNSKKFIVKKNLEKHKSEFSIFPCCFGSEYVVSLEINVHRKTVLAETESHSKIQCVRAYSEGIYVAGVHCGQAVLWTLCL